LIFSAGALPLAEPDADGVAAVLHAVSATALMVARVATSVLCIRISFIGDCFDWLS
jgi:hypothetical protein